MDTSKLDDFTRAYIECALWSSTDNADESGGEPLDNKYSVLDIADYTLSQMAKDCKAFQADNEETLSKVYEEFEWYTWERAGHDFWLTRNRHGTGFWDRTVQSPELWKKLTDEAHAYGEFDLYVGDDGKIGN